VNFYKRKKLEGSYVFELIGRSKELRLAGRLLENVTAVITYPENNIKAEHGVLTFIQHVDNACEGKKLNHNFCK
jgi:hypothetical protein